MLHSMFSDQEMEDIVSAWEILIQDKRVRYLREAAAETSREEWTKLYPQAEHGGSQSQWQARYGSRAGCFQYTHLYYYLRRPE